MISAGSRLILSTAYVHTLASSTKTKTDGVIRNACTAFLELSWLFLFVAGPLFTTHLLHLDRLRFLEYQGK